MPKGPVDWPFLISLPPDEIMTSPASSAQIAAHQTELGLFFTLLQIIVIIGAARVAAAVAVRVKQSPAVGEIIVGILLGPSLFGLLAPGIFQYVFHSVPSAPITMLSQIGLILLMFQIGLEFDFGHLRTRKNRSVVIAVAATGILFPFALGLALGFVSAPYLAPSINATAYALFIATALSITAVPILGRIMMEFNITRHYLGAITITAAAINDVIGWFLLAAITALTLSAFSLPELSARLGFFALYIGVCWWIVRPLLKRIIARAQISADKFPDSMLALLLVLIFASAIATYKIGIFAIFGGFMLGVILFDQYGLIEAWRKRISGFITVFFLPIFFTYTGLRTDINGLDSMALWGWFALMLGAATLGKFGGCYWASRRCGLDRTESKIIAVMMNTRALMELIVLNMGLDLGVIPPPVFTMLVLMAIISTLITAPFLRYWLPQLGAAAPALESVASESKA